MLTDIHNRLENNNMTETVAAVAAKVTGVSAAGTSVLAATLDVPHLLGYTVEEWQIIGIITGVITGSGGLLVMTIFNILNYRLKASRINAQDGD